MLEMITVSVVDYRLEQPHGFIEVLFVAAPLGMETQSQDNLKALYQTC